MSKKKKFKKTFKAEILGNLQTKPTDQSDNKQVSADQTNSLNQNDFKKSNLKSDNVAELDLLPVKKDLKKIFFTVVVLIIILVIISLTNQKNSWVDNLSLELSKLIHLNQ